MTLTKRPIDDEFSTESVFAEQLPKEGDTADDQFTFVEELFFL
jgi:hypothetical protein